MFNGENRKVQGTRIRDFWENAAKGTDPTMANGTYRGIREEEGNDFCEICEIFMNWEKEDPRSCTDCQEAEKKQILDSLIVSEELVCA